jgi:hypothetical protein
MQSENKSENNDLENPAEFGVFHTPGE